MSDHDDFCVADVQHQPQEIPLPTVSALLGERGREEQRSAWDRARAVAVDLQLTLPTIAALREQKLRAGPWIAPAYDERRESRDEYRRRCERERAARPKENYGDTTLVVVTNSEGRRVELDAEAGCIVTDMGDE